MTEVFSPKFCLPNQFVSSLKVLFDVLDDEKSGYVKLYDIESRWKDGGTQGLPPGVLGNLRKVASDDGLLTFEQFVSGLQSALVESRGYAGSGRATGPAVSGGAARGHAVTVLPSVVSKPPIHQFQHRAASVPSLFGSEPEQPKNGILDGRSSAFTAASVARRGSSDAPSKASPKHSWHDVSNEVPRSGSSSSDLSVNDHGTQAGALPWSSAAATLPSVPPWERQQSQPHNGRLGGSALSLSDSSSGSQERLNRVKNGDAQHAGGSHRAGYWQPGQATQLHLTVPGVPDAVAAAAGAADHLKVATLPTATHREGERICGSRFQTKSVHEQSAPFAVANPFSGGDALPKAVDIGNAVNRSEAGDLELGRNEPLRRIVPRRRESLRRHTLGHGLDYNTVRRIQQLEKERDMLLRGLQSVDLAREWYLSRINHVSEKQQYASSDQPEHAVDSNEERLNFESSLIQEVNQQLKMLTDSSTKGFPLHMHLAVPKRLPDQSSQASRSITAEGSSDDSSHVAALLRAQNKMLTREIAQKNGRISQLEREKALLLKDTFELRSRLTRQQPQANPQDDDNLSLI